MDLSLNEIACKNIREIREKLGLSQKQIAESLNIERTTYNKIELGKTELTLTVLEKISLLLDSNISNILNIKESKVDNVKADKVLFSANAVNANMHLYISKDELERIKTDVENY